MSIHQAGARLSMKDVEELSIASDSLAVAAETIRRMRPAWGEAVVNLLIVANRTIERLHNRGAGRYARYRAKHDAQGAQDVPETPPASDTINQERNAAPDDPEAA